MTRPVAAQVDGAGHQFFTGAGLAHHQHRRVDPGGAVDEGEDRVHPRRGADDPRLVAALKGALAVGHNREEVWPELQPDPVDPRLAGHEGAPETLDAQVEWATLGNELLDG